MKRTRFLAALACTILLLIPAIPAQALGASCTAEGEVTLTLNAQTDDATTISILGSGSGSVTCQVSQSACGVSALGDVQVGGFASAGFLTITAVFTGNGSVFLECPPGGGERMTGGGGIGAPRGHVRLGTVLHCSTTSGPNRLQVSWGGGNRFHLESLTSASCTDNPSLEPDPPYAPFDTYSGRGSGTLNGVSGATAEWTFVDGGEPAADSLSITVKDSLGQVVLSASGSLERGNLNAHDVSDGPDSGVFILRR